MKRLTRVLLGALCLSVLGFALSFLTSSPAPAAPTSVPVTVVNTPLPVSGMVSVSSLPAVTFNGTPAVKFTNTNTTPLFVRDVDNPALQPFAMTCQTQTFDDTGGTTCDLGTVPAGKRFVIETVSGQLNLSPGTRPLHIALQLNGNSVDRTTTNYFPAAFQGSSCCYFGDYYTVNQQVRLYEDAGLSPFFAILISGKTSGLIELSVTGYLVNLP